MESNWLTDPRPPRDEDDLTDFETEAREYQTAALRADSPSEALRGLQVGEVIHFAQYQRTPQIGGIVARLRDTDSMTFTTWRDDMLGCVAVRRLT